MKIHAPIFILGLLVFITPIIGLPQIYEQIILAAYGLAIMILVSTIKIVEDVKNKNEIFTELDLENNTVNHDQKEI
jgi:hypothetical protein